MNAGTTHRRTPTAILAKRIGRSGVTAVALFLLAGLLTPALASSSVKPYTATVSPVAIGAGSTVAGASITITNAAANQSLGSANITPPVGLSVSGVSADRGDVGVSGGTITLRNAGVAPGASVTVSFALAAACGSAGGSWGLAVKQSNDFNGPPGNSFTLSGSAPTTSVSGSCRLAFVTQPANATITTVITGSPFNPSGDPVSVAALAGDGSPVDGVAISLAATPATAISGGSAATGPSGAPASFAALGIGTAGTYTLTASATGFSSIDSGPFTITDTATICEAGVSCTANDGDNQGTTSVTSQGGSGDPGYISISLSGAGGASCGSYTPHSSLSTVDVTTGEPSTATLTIIKALSGKAGASSFQICFASDLPFTDRDGATVTPGDFGLLPDCDNQAPVAPCVLSRNRSQHTSNVIITFIFPAADPKFFG